MTASNQPIIKSPFLITSRRFPPEGDLLTDVLSKSYTDTAIAINNRTIGIYDEFEVVSGNQYFSETGPDRGQNPVPQRRQAYRRAYRFTGNPTTIPHELSFIHRITQCYGTAETDTGIFIPLPYPAVDTTEIIEVNADQSNINFTYGSGAFTLVSGMFVLEYILRTQ